MARCMVVRLGLVSALALGVAAPGCPDGVTASLSISAPAEGRVFHAADDVSASIGGVQINVTATVRGFSSGQIIHLSVNGLAGMDRSYDGSGTVVFNDVTLVPAENTITVSAGNASAVVHVTLESDACPRLTFRHPEASASIGTDEDSDPVASGFQYDVRVDVADGDGMTVELFVGDTSAATATAAGGFVEFQDITLADPTPTTATNVILRAQTSGTCTATITARLDPAVGPCPSFAFTEPRDGRAFGVSDDLDGNPDNGFQRNVQIATNADDGTSVDLYVNDALNATALSTGLVVSFESVTLTEGSVTLRVQTTEACSESISVTVTTGAPTCAIVFPVGPNLIAENDSDPVAPGFQTDVEVSTDAEDGQSVELLVNDAESAMAFVSSGRARFSDIPLPEGPNTMQGRCHNAVGNVGLSTVRPYFVDSIVPTVEITSPLDGAWYNDVDGDALPSVPGTQVEIAIHTTDSPTTATVSRCGYEPLDPEGWVTLDALGDGTGYVPLAGVGNSVCANVQDDAGNVAEASITLNLETEGPQFEIRRPDPATTLILAVDDEGPSDTLCQYTVTVGCSNVGLPVTLYVNTIPKTPETCIASVDPLGGTATWSSTSLPQGSVTLRADGESAGGLGGTSPDKVVTVDTEPPVLDMSVPACGRVFTPADDLVDGPADGIQVRVEVRTSDPAPVTLNVTDGGGSPISGSPYVSTPTGGYAVFPSVTIVPPGLTFGTAFLAASATDEHAQTGTSTPSPCGVEVRDLPQVVITSPAAGALLGPSADCNAGSPGFDLRVVVQTNIAAGAGTVELFVGGPSAGSQTYPGTPVTFCVPAADGASVTVRAEGTDARGTGSAQINVLIDSTPPDDPVDDLVGAIANRRGGSLDLNWTAPSDAGGGSVSGYQIRCMSAAAAGASFDWATANPYSFIGSAGAPGAPQTQRLSGFRIERYVTCMVRSTDAVGSLGPVGSTAEVHFAFLQAAVLGEPTASQFGYEIAPLGDVNGDTRPDFGVGTNVGSTAYLFFGSDSGAPATWSTRINGTAGSNFGYSIAGVGDFNGDTLGDVLIGAWGYSSGRGRAYLFFGRSSWPAVLDVATANVTFINDDPSSAQDDGANFGFDLAGAGDFDGDTRPDILIGSRGWNAFQGAGLLYFGRASPPASVTVPGDRSTGFAGDMWLAAGSVGNQFGNSSAGGFRVNTDSFDDVVIGAPFGVSGGAVYVALGRARTIFTGLTTISTYDQQILSPVAANNANFGVALSLGILNADARPDLLVAMDQPPGAASYQGGVMTYLNTSGAFPSAYSGMIRNDAASPSLDRMGFFLPTGQVNGSTALADVNADGRMDVMVGMMQLGTDQSASRLFIDRDYSATVLSSSADLASAAEAAPAPSSSTVGYVQDVTGDTYPDIAVGHARHASDQGRVLVLY